MSTSLFCHSKDSPTDTYEELKTSSFPVVSVVRDKLSGANENITEVTENFKQLHFSIENEAWIPSGVETSGKLKEPYLS